MRLASVTDSDLEKENLDCKLVRRFVDEALNGCDLSVLREVLSTRFRDHDPVRLPGQVDGPASFGSIRHVESLVEFLAQPTVDIAFVLEDLFGAGGRVGYRLFGQGTISLSPEGLALGESRPGLPEGKLLGNRLAMEYSSTGIFGVEGGRIVERWGLVVLR
jgi:hypothetical protein